MSRIISYKGRIAMGLQDRINLRTLKGKVGYRITKFETISAAPGTTNQEFIAKIFKTDQTGSIGNAVDFTDSDLLAVNYNVDKHNTDVAPNQTIIFDNEVFNQNIFISITDPSGETTECNYYIELEVMSLNDVETTMLTLKSIRSITS